MRQQIDVDGPNPWANKKGLWVRVESEYPWTDRPTNNIYTLATILIWRPWHKCHLSQKRYVTTQIENYEFANISLQTKLRWCNYTYVDLVNQRTGKYKIRTEFPTLSSVKK